MVLTRDPWERFVEKVSTETSDCWEWQAARTNGYGRFKLGHSSYVLAHRWAYEYIVGPIPQGLVIDHLCRNRACVNPRHMEPVTRVENILRGETLPARNLAKTHCPKGHPYSGDNLIVERRSGSRRCRVCVNDRARRKYWAQKARFAGEEAWP